MHAYTSIKIKHLKNNLHTRRRWSGLLLRQSSFPLQTHTHSQVSIITYGIGPGQSIVNALNLRYHNGPTVSRGRNEMGVADKGFDSLCMF